MCDRTQLVVLAELYFSKFPLVLARIRKYAQEHDEHCVRLYMLGATDMLYTSRLIDDVTYKRIYAVFGISAKIVEITMHDDLAQYGGGAHAS